MTPASKHLAHARAIRLEAPAQRQRGWMPKLFAASARGGAFSLDIFFYRTKRAALESDQYNSSASRSRRSCR